MNEIAPYEHFNLRNGFLYYYFQADTRALKKVYWKHWKV
jgi:hypothetical protein